MHTESNISSCDVLPTFGRSGLTAPLQSYKSTLMSHQPASSTFNGKVLTPGLGRKRDCPHPAVGGGPRQHVHKQHVRHSLQHAILVGVYAQLGYLVVFSNTSQSPGRRSWTESAKPPHPPHILLSPPSLFPALRLLQARRSRVSKAVSPPS